LAVWMPTISKDARIDHGGESADFAPSFHNQNHVRGSSIRA
jgi:hypothetical protein